ncbi:MAG: hypothetical protein O6931_00785 [Gammaproteobacteria bacterium]|nr:hypothetical protein [Gammaproteobacteria bacterium]
MIGCCLAVPAERNNGLGVHLFTCCPNCETVFKVTAKHLQQAAGQVRCGNCEFAFSALSNIQETASAAVANLQVLAEKSDDAGNPPDDLLDEAISDPEQRESWQRLSTTKSSTVDTWAEKFSKDFGDIDDDELLQIDHPIEAAADDTEDSAKVAQQTVDDEQTSSADEVVLVEDAEAFEAAVLATIHATESKAWESSGPHFIGSEKADHKLADDEIDLPATEAVDDQSLQVEAAIEDGDLSEDEKVGAESAADVDNEWLSNEAEDTDLDEDHDQPSMDFLEQLAAGAGVEASLEDINVDDEDESQLLADDDLLEDDDEDEASIDDDLLTYEVEPDEPVEDEIELDEPIEVESAAVADEDLLIDEDDDEPETADVEDLMADEDEDQAEDEDVDEPDAAVEEDLAEGEEVDEPDAAVEEDLTEGEEVDEPETTEEEGLAGVEEVDESETTEE